MGNMCLYKDLKKTGFLLKKGLRDTIVMVRSPFTGDVLAFVGSVGTVNYYFDLKKFRGVDRR